MTTKKTFKRLLERSILNSGKSAVKRGSRNKYRNNPYVPIYIYNIYKYVYYIYVHTITKECMTRCFITHFPRSLDDSI